MIAIAKKVPRLEDNRMEDLSNIDKLTESFSIRIPEITKHRLDKLSPAMKRRLNDSILIAMARVLHDSEFDPSMYLKSE